MTFQLKSMN